MLAIRMIYQLVSYLRAVIKNVQIIVNCILRLYLWFPGHGFKWLSPILLASNVLLTYRSVDSLRPSDAYIRQ